MSYNIIRFVRTQKYSICNGIGFFYNSFRLFTLVFLLSEVSCNFKYVLKYVIYANIYIYIFVY